MINFTLRVFIILATICSLFSSCKKSDSVTGPLLPDLQTKVSASASGFVTDENNTPLVGASVRLGTTLVTTDQFGFFKFENVQVVKTAAVITVTHSGYFKGIRTFAAKENAPVFVRIKLSPKNIIGTIDASAGGSVSTSQGLSVVLSANSVVNKTTGAAYTGTVTVLAKWLDPTSNDIAETMPGDLRALNEAGEMKLLITYGMVGVELIGDAGEQLQIAAGKISTLSFPIPASMSSVAPASIPLWHFDEQKGLWIEEGSAVKTGNVYVGEVSHYTFWNVDVPTNFVNLDGRLLNAAGNPISFARITIFEASNPLNSRSGFTNTQGYFSGFVPANSALVLEVNNAMGSCSQSLLTQNFQTTDVDLSLGNLAFAGGSSQIAEVRGVVVDCNGNPSPGTTIFYTNGSQTEVYPTDSLGNFSFNALLCSGATQVEFTSWNGLGFSSVPNIVTLNPGLNVLDTIFACSGPTGEYIIYSINNNTWSFSEPPNQLTQSILPNNAMQVLINAGNNQGTLVFDPSGIHLNSDQRLYSFTPVDVDHGPPMAPVPGDSLMVRISEYGPLGGYITININGNMVSAFTPVGLVYNVQATIRVRRDF